MLFELLITRENHCEMELLRMTATAAVHVLSNLTGINFEIP